MGKMSNKKGPVKSPFYCNSCLVYLTSSVRQLQVLQALQALQVLQVLQVPQQELVQVLLPSEPRASEPQASSAHSR